MSPPFLPSVLESFRCVTVITTLWQAQNICCTTNALVLKSQRTRSTHDQSVICEGSLLETIPPFQSYVSESVRFVSLIIVSSCVVRMKRQSSHGGSWVDSGSPRREQKSWWWTVLMSTVVMEDMNSLHVNACRFLNRSAEGSQDCPSSRNISWQSSYLMSFNAPSFPRHGKALTMSHQVYACIPIR